MIKNNNILLLFTCILLLFSSCSGFIKAYSESDKGYGEGSTDLGPVITNVRFLNRQSYTFPFKYFQSILPLPYENYKIIFLLFNKNHIKNTGGIMRSMYFDEFRIVLPSGKIIDLLEGNIDVIYQYLMADETTDTLSKKIQNVKPTYIDGVKRLYIDGIKDGDGINTTFYTKIPSSFDNIRLEYTLTIEWENLGTMKEHTILIFNKKVYEWYSLTT